MDRTWKEALRARRGPLILLAVVFLLSAFFFFPRPPRLPREVTQVFWVGHLSDTGEVRDRESCQALREAAGQLALRPVGFYGSPTIYEGGGTLYSTSWWGEKGDMLEFFMDDKGILYQDHIIYRYTGGETLLALLEEERASPPGGEA